MKHDIKKCLFDIKVSIDSIDDYLEGKRDFLKYQENKLLRRGVEREIGIIGEAVNRILKEDSSITIQNAKKIISTRDKVNGYDKVDNVVIWEIISNHLPKLKIEVENLLKEQ